MTVVQRSSPRKSNAGEGGGKGLWELNKFMRRNGMQHLQKRLVAYGKHEESHREGITDGQRFRLGKGRVGSYAAWCLIGLGNQGNGRESGGTITDCTHKKQWAH